MFEPMGRSPSRPAVLRGACLMVVVGAACVPDYVPASLADGSSDAGEPVDAGSPPSAWADVHPGDTRPVGQWSEESTGLPLSISSDASGLRYSLTARDASAPETGVLQVGAGWLLRFPDGGVVPHRCNLVQLLVTDAGMATHMRWGPDTAPMNVGTASETCAVDSAAPWAASFRRM
jgi:hypothetical protein